MQTGYTAYIEDGEIATGKEFLKLCTRAFGIAISLKDEPLSVPTPRSFQPDSYYKDRYDRALKKLEEVSNMTFDKAKIQMKASYEKRISDYKAYAEREIAKNEKYTKVRKEVDAWIPPTEEHKGLKKFALGQIDMCVTKQKCIDEYLEKSKEKFDDSDEAVRNYIDEIITYHQEEVERSYKYWQEELERTRNKNEWMAKFLESLEK